MFSQPGTRHVFVFEDAEKHLICAYTNEAEWAKVPGQQDVEFVVVGDLVGSELRTVLVQRLTEDTTNNDEYTLGSNGTVLRLKRTLDVIPERVTREQKWDVRAGRAIKVAESWLEYQTHKPLPPERRLDQLVELPRITQFSHLPFFSLIMDPHSERWTMGKRCVSGSLSEVLGDH
jgi:hypothetical protein